MLWLVWLNQELVTVLPLADFKKPGRFVFDFYEQGIILQKTKRTFLQAHFKKVAMPGTVRV